MKKRIIILGSTGSIGTNCLDIVKRLPEKFEVVALTTNSRVDLLKNQVKEFKPAMAAITGVDSDPGISSDTRYFYGKDALVQILEENDYDLLINAVVGAAGFLPTLKALEQGKNVALANKETLVVGGEIITRIAKENNCSIWPIDSEHSAIFQCLMGEEYSNIDKIILTASGGPFRASTMEELEKVTVEQALKHPNWNMGHKITIDSATMMNKGLEVIEARWLFDVTASQIEVVIHPQSIIHSMVEFCDGSIKAQLGVPDMRIPIQLAMTFPDRFPSDLPRLDFKTLKNLTFEQPDFKKFKALKLAFESLETQGTAPAVLNASNEIAVALFLHKKIKFLDIANIVENVLNDHQVVKNPQVNDLLYADEWARKKTSEYGSKVDC